MGNQQPKDKLCLIPPTIKQRRRDILDRSEVRAFFPQMLL
jgi:hypothetical protein